MTPSSTARGSLEYQFTNEVTLAPIAVEVQSKEPHVAYRQPFCLSSRLVNSILIQSDLWAGHLAQISERGKPVPIKPSSKAQQVTKHHKEGEIIVKFKQDAPQSLRDLVVQTYASSEKQSRGRGKLSTLRIKGGLDLSDTIFNIKQMDAIVEYAEPNYVVTRTGNLKKLNRHALSKPTTKIPNDSRFSLQWALSNAGQNNGAPGSDIGALAGWQQTTGSEKTIIAVIDTGVDARHPDLARNLWVNKQESKGKRGEDDDGDGYFDNVSGWNFVNDSNNVTDDHGHGTAMAGIIAAEGDNREGIAGVMRRASIMALKAERDAPVPGTLGDLPSELRIQPGRCAQAGDLYGQQLDQERQLRLQLCRSDCEDRDEPQSAGGSERQRDEDSQLSSVWSAQERRFRQRAEDRTGL